jgi:hypothetical protein
LIARAGKSLLLDYSSSSLKVMKSNHQPVIISLIQMI